MKVSARMKYIDAEQGISRDGKTYYVIGLLQGMESEKIYINKEIYDLTAGFKQFSDVDCTLNIQIGQTRTFVNLDSIQLVEKEVKNGANK